jgi:hypothetical protein
MPRRTTWYFCATIALPLIVAVGLWLGSSARPLDADTDQDSRAEAARSNPDPVESVRVRVAVVNPSAGGVPRTASLPCSAHWHESAELFSKVSG